MHSSYNERSEGFSALLREIGPVQEGFATEICSCCGFPTLRSIGDWEECFLCRWEDDETARRLPNEPGGPNGAFSLTDARVFFDDWLTHFPPHDQRGWVEFVSCIRAMKRLIIDLFNASLEHRASALILLGLANKGKRQLYLARAALRERFLDDAREERQSPDR